jgi:hypothetical protein
MKKILVMMAVLALIVPCAGAEVIQLKSGTVMNAKILEKSGQKLQVDINGVVLTYYLDDILSINDREPIEYLNDSFLASPEEAVYDPNPAPTPPPIPVAAPPVPAVTTPAVVAPPPEKSLSPAKRELILQFLKVFGTRNNLEQNFAVMIQRLPPAHAEEVKKATNIDEIIEQLIPIYDKHFTEAQLKAYVDFYSSPEGQALMKNLPKVIEDSVGVSLEYFKTKFPPSVPVQKK